MAGPAGIFSGLLRLCCRGVFGWLPWGSPRTTEVDRIEALQVAPIEELDTFEGVPTWVAAGAQTRGALPVVSEFYGGAVFSSRGRGYARYNEDAAVLLRDRRGWLYAAAFDQAGGLGGTVRGEASALAARAATEAFRQVAETNDPSESHIARRLEEAVWSAHHRLVERGEGEVTTAVMLVARPGQAVILNSGDSGALHFSKGALVQRTRMHEASSPVAMGMLTHAVGLIPEEPGPETYIWTLEPGDWLVLGSDGLLDFGGEERELGGWLDLHPDPVNAVNEVVGRVLRRMSFMQAKPDNLTVVGLKAASPDHG